MSKREGDPGYAAGRCIHYRSPSAGGGRPGHDTCEAGVDYASFHGVKFDRRPCFLDTGGCSKPDAIACEHLRPPSPEEIAAHETWIKGRMSQLGVVMAGIYAWRIKHKGKSHAEIVECPACKGQLSLSISAYNGHVHGHCRTAGCVSWME
jgi:hypothetical protein